MCPRLKDRTNKIRNEHVSRSTRNFCHCYNSFLLWSSMYFFNCIVCNVVVKMAMFLGIVSSCKKHYYNNYCVWLWNVF